MGMLSKRKGRAYEQHVARVLRERWPGVEVHRSMQSEKALNSDVYIANGPLKLEQIWWECEDSRTPNPTRKMEQAERDIAALRRTDRLPVVIWHRIGERTHYATTRLYVLDELRGLTGSKHVVRNENVTLELGAFLDVLSGGVKP